MIIGVDASRANRDHRSGTEWYAYHIIKCLAKLDKKNQYILYSDKPLKGGLINLNSSSGEDLSNLEPKIDKKGWQKIISPNNNFKGKILKWPFKYFWTQGRMSIEMLFNKPDILFIPAHALPIIHPKKSIVTIHDIGYERDGSLYQKEKIGAEDIKNKKIINILVKLLTLGKYGANSFDYLKWSTRHILKEASQVITISEFTKSEIEKIYKKNFDNIKMIYHGYDPGLYKKINDENKINKILNRFEIKRPYFLYIGRIERKKNTPALIEAFAIFKEKEINKKYKLLLVGDASFGYDEAKYMANEFGIEKDIYMPGWVKEKHIPYLYNGASAFVFPSKYEGFGLPLLHAMACEVPIIASNIASIPEIAEGAALLFDPDNIRSIASAMMEISSNDDLKKRLIDLGKKRVKNFDWSKTAEKTLEIFNE